MVFSSGKIEAVFDASSGFTKAIYNPDDTFRMNWVLEKSDWGRVDGFQVCSTEEIESGMRVYGENKQETLSLTVEKTVKDGKYTETYSIKNNGISEFFLTKDNFGIHFPYNCTFENKKNMHDNSCITHVWCGEDCAWMYSAKPCGEKPYLVGNAVEGSIADYSISYDISRVKVGASYRGDIVLHSKDRVILPGQSIRFSFVFYFSDIAPDAAALNEYLRMRLEADKYSAFIGEVINCKFDSIDPWNSLELFCDGQKIEYQKSGNQAFRTLSFDTPGERTVSVSVNGRHTRMEINVLPPLDEMLIKRAEFITKKQQYHREGSRLDGAYLIYDRTTGKQYYSESFCDRNACRERLSMGVVVAQALQKKYDERMMQSLIKHRRFIEREIFDDDSATVCNGVGRDNGWHRAYNYPWMSVYYLEWYNLTGETECLKNAARIMLSYYEKAGGGRQESPCMRILEICRLLEKEGFGSLLEILTSHLYAHADRIIREGSACFSEEVSCTQFMFDGKINILCQAYELSKNRKYLDCVPEFIKRSNAFCARQPDFHTNLTAVRYWDLYWFGKSRTYGDTMPQWLSALSGETYDFLYKAGFGEQYRLLSRAVLMNNLCVYSSGGFASAGYLMPYRIVQYSSDSLYTNKWMKPGTTYGHIYDDYANDQDWAMYYAVKILEEKAAEKI